MFILCFQCHRRNQNGFFLAYFSFKTKFILVLIFRSLHGFLISSVENKHFFSSAVRKRLNRGLLENLEDIDTNRTDKKCCQGKLPSLIMGLFFKVANANKWENSAGIWTGSIAIGQQCNQILTLNFIQIIFCFFFLQSYYEFCNKIKKLKV